MLVVPLGHGDQAWGAARALLPAAGCAGEAVWGREAVGAPKAGGCLRVWLQEEAAEGALMAQLAARAPACPPAPLYMNPPPTSPPCTPLHDPSSHLFPQFAYICIKQ